MGSLWYYININSTEAKNGLVEFIPQGRHKLLLKKNIIFKSGVV